MSPIIGQVTLGVYAVLLAAGGVMGYVKARSKPSLIAGVSSAVLAIICEVVIRWSPAAGLWLGALLALLMVAVFTMRFAKTRKLMPSGLLGAISVAVLVVLVVDAIGAHG